MNIKLLLLLVLGHILQTSQMAKSQSSTVYPPVVQLIAVDSLTVPNHNSIMIYNLTRIYNDQLYTFDNQSANIEVYDLKGQRVQTIPIEQSHQKKRFPRQYVTGYVIANDKIYTLNPINIVSHSSTERFIPEWKMPFGWWSSQKADDILPNKEKLWAVDNFSATHSHQMNPQHLIYPVQYFSKYKRTKRRFHKNLDNILLSHDSLTLLPSNPQLLHIVYDSSINQYVKRNTIGRIPARYQQEIHQDRYNPVSALEISFEVDTAKQQVLISNPMDSLITVYGYDGMIVRQFGRMGRFITPVDTVHYLNRKDLDIKNPPACRNGICTFSKETSLLNTKMFIYRQMTPMYSYIHHSAQTNLFFRAYHSNPEKPAPAIRDSLIHKEIPFDANKHGHKSFLQIYDLSDNDRLIFDGPVPAPFKVLDVDTAGYLWAIVGRKDDKILIRKYKIVWKRNLIDKPLNR